MSRCEYRQSMLERVPERDLFTRAEGSLLACLHCPYMCLSTSRLIVHVMSIHHDIARILWERQEQELLGESLEPDNTQEDEDQDEDKLLGGEPLDLSVQSAALHVSTSHSIGGVSSFCMYE